MRELRRHLERSLALAMALLGTFVASGLAAPAMTANEAQFSRGVVDTAVGNPSNAQAYLQSAIQHFATSTNAAVGLVSLFAAELGDVAACDAEQAKDLAKALADVLKDPANATLLAQLPTADIATAIASAGGGEPLSIAGSASHPGDGAGVFSAGTPSSPTGAFGSFGSSTGTGVATSPAT